MIRKFSTKSFLFGVLFGLIFLSFQVQPIFAFPFWLIPKPAKPLKPTLPPKPPKIIITIPPIPRINIPPIKRRLTPTSAVTPTVTPSFAPTPTVTPIAVVLVFAQNLPTTQNGPAITIPAGYKSITFSVTPPSFFAGWSPQVSFDGGETWFEQHRFGCCQEVTIPILDSIYRFSPGTGSGPVNATGTLNTEPMAQVLLLEQNINYPFTSSPFLTDGFSTITITAGGGDNPQHLTGVSLQLFENSSFIEKQHLICDGGARCPLQDLPVIDGIYRVVLEGNGNGAVLGAILRP